MISRFIVRDDNIGSDYSSRLNWGQAMLRGRNAAKGMLNVCVRDAKG